MAILLGGLIVITVLLSAALFFILQKFNILQPNGLPPSASGSTLKWNTYSNNNFLFSIKYPQEQLRSFIVEAETKESLQIHATSLDKNNTRDFPPFSIYITVNEYKNDLATYANAQMQSRSYIHARKTSTSLAGIPAYAVTRIPQDLEVPRIFSYEIYIKKGLYLYDISLSSEDQKILETNKNLFDTMLTTLRFNP